MKHRRLMRFSRDDRKCMFATRTNQPTRRTRYPIQTHSVILCAWGACTAVPINKPLSTSHAAGSTTRAFSDDSTLSIVAHSAPSNSNRVRHTHTHKHTWTRNNEVGCVLCEGGGRDKNRVGLTLWGDSHTSGDKLSATL